MLKWPLNFPLELHGQQNLEIQEFRPVGCDEPQRWASERTIIQQGGGDVNMDSNLRRRYKSIKSDPSKKQLHILTNTSFIVAHNILL